MLDVLHASTIVGLTSLLFIAENNKSKTSIMAHMAHKISRHKSKTYGTHQTDKLKPEIIHTTYPA